VDLSNIAADTGIGADEAKTKLEENMKMEGFQVEINDKGITIIG
jgi:hypothetical protein